MVEISERSLEATIERALLAGGADALPEPVMVVRERRPQYGEPWPSAPVDTGDDEAGRDLDCVPAVQSAAMPP